jgi:hypothetical protein
MKTNETEFRIGNRSDSLALLGEMTEKCEAINAEAPPSMRGTDKAIGSTGYFYPRLAALRDAVEQGII